MNWNKITYFKPTEFVCSCGCGRGADEMNEQFVAALDLARKRAGLPFRVTSGFRCARHNKNVGGAADSSHTRGLAVDIAIQTSAQRYEILTALMGFFDRIGLGKGFIHVDMDPTKVGNVVWVY